MAVPSTNRIAAMSTADKLGMVVRKAATLLPTDVGRHLLAFVSPSALATMAGVVVIWAGAHFFGVGEIADVVLLAAGWMVIGSGALQGGRKLIEFAVATQSAATQADLDRAAHALADAITIIGIDVVLTLLFKNRPKTTFHEPFQPQIAIPSYRQFARVMPKSGPTRMYEAKLIFTKSRWAGQGGTAPVTNNATVGRNYYPEARSLEDAVRGVRRTVYHERVHQRLTQAFSLLGRPALYMKMGAYKRSYILRYIEEAAAEAYGIAKTGGLRPGELSGIQFPLNGNYGVTLVQMGGEAKGILLGPVTVGGASFQAYYGLIDDHQ